MGAPLVFKTATEATEIEQIHQLNYRIFVEEIPQHTPNAERRLVDKFHAENTYLICLCDRQVVGMMAVRGKRPFSLDQKLPNLDSYLPHDGTRCEVRLLAVDKDFRYGQVLKGLLALLWQHAIEQGFDLGVISGTTRQIKLYQHLGFTPFGPLVGTGDAMFQPMYVTMETFEQGAREFLRNTPSGNFQRNVANFLPGPVAIHRDVRLAFEQKPESHRGPLFVQQFHALQSRLCHLTRARHVEIFLGSGTMANDIVAGQLSIEQQPGLIISNGEFGERLLDHARRWNLRFETLKLPWGAAVDFSRLQRIVKRADAPKWIWCTHCETSTGVMNDLAALKAFCATQEMKLCFDCISSLGTVPLNLDGVYLASGSSGKGLASYPGLSMVFHHHRPVASASLPRYLDLGFYADQQGIPFTQSSNLVHALAAAIERRRWDEHFTLLSETSAWLREQLRALGFHLIGDPTAALSPAVITIKLPWEISSTQVGAQLNEAGYLLSCNSDYLRQRNWIQICLMGEATRAQMESLLKLLPRVCNAVVKDSAAPTLA